MSDGQEQSRDTSVRAHLTAAQEAAADDLTSYLALASVVDESIAPGGMSPDELMKQPAPPPAQVFDNLFFVGSSWVSAWAITTSEGIILIDTMDNDDEAQHIVDAGLRTLGLNPAQIAVIVITHGHGDHYGGSGFFTRTYNPRVIMSGEDWTMLETELEFDRPDWGRPPQRDLTVEDGSVLRLGDTEITVVLTPGHTWGTISLLFDARSGDATHRTMLWGGTAFNFADRSDRLDRIRAYIDATDRARELARTQDVSVFISNHSIYDEAVDKAEQVRHGDANPFIIGSDATGRALTVMGECARAALVAWGS